MPAETTAELLEFPFRPYSLNTVDVAALQALAPMLDGAWSCEALVNDDGDTWAFFEDHTTLRMFIVCRSGRQLRLFNKESELVASFTSVDVLTAILGNAVGRRAS